MFPNLSHHIHSSFLFPVLFMKKLEIAPKNSLLFLSPSAASPSQASLLSVNHPKKTKVEAIPSVASEEKKGRAYPVKKMKNLLAVLKHNISAGLQRLIKSFKSFSYIFVYKDELEDIEIEIEMEIGFPTDVKHVTHIGWDGSATTNPLKGWDNLKAPEVFSLPTMSLRQFELAMAAQADHAPLVVRSSEVS